MASTSQLGHHRRSSRETTDMLVDIRKKRGKLRVGVSEIVPWAMHDKDGNLFGFEIDVARN
jgi:polar amino acid transport system substrate-binding protein